ncbi:hypothetical protein CUZ96_1378 [Enterococcus lactis]|nr:hypothetical protein [Enterococcus faecium]MBL5003301.1 hypothetical protein [Enterococcus lactis]MBK4757017.1 hypothetical protein [Enterococcus faecium]MBK4762986.1 hypothetical protein [Enterococcus faecium]MBK4776880.1 hypothetical protein [Enterococcus faecium]
MIRMQTLHLFFIAKKEPPGCVELDANRGKEETRNAYN